jgi:hypothetical protein
MRQTIVEIVARTRRIGVGLHVRWPETLEGRAVPSGTPWVIDGEQWIELATLGDERMTYDGIARTGANGGIVVANYPGAWGSASLKDLDFTKSFVIDVWVNIQTTTGEHEFVGFSFTRDVPLTGDGLGAWKSAYGGMDPHVFSIGVDGWDPRFGPQSSQLVMADMNRLASASTFEETYIDECGHIFDAGEVV